MAVRGRGRRREMSQGWPGWAQRSAVWGAVLLAVSGGAYVAMVAPAYRYADEPAHVGYALVLDDGQLPTIDTPIPTGWGDRALDEATDSPWFPHRRDVYVANNPPYPYVAAVAAGRVLDEAGADHGVLQALRALAVVGAGAAVVLTHRLTRDLAGGDDLAGLGAAGLLAATSGVTLQTASAGLDGPALAAGVGVAWGLVRFLDRPGAGRALQLGGWAALATAVRPMTAAVAVLAVAVAVAVVVVDLVRRRRVPGGGFVVLAALVAPALVVGGWWYRRNDVLYGGPTASRALLAKAGRVPNDRSWWELLAEPGWLTRHLGDLVRADSAAGDFMARGDGLDALVSLGAVAVVLGAVVTAARSTPDDRHPGGGGRLPVGGWLAVALLAGSYPVLMAAHVARGGGEHSRYLLPVLPLVAAAAVVLARRLPRRFGGWLVTALVAAHLLWHLSRLREAASAALDPELPEPLVGQPWRAGALVGATVGAVVLVVGLVATAVAASEPSPGEDVAPAGGADGPCSTVAGG